MARRSRVEKTEGPLTRAELDGLINKIELMRQEMLTHCTDEFTHNDYFDLFVPTDLQQAFRDVHKYAYMPTYYYYRTFNIWWVPLNQKIRVSLEKYHGQDAPLILIDPMLELKAPAELLNRVTSLVTERTRINTDFGRVEAVVKALNKYCETPSQMRFFWPQIAMLADRAGLSSLVEKMKFNPRDICTLPVAVRKACREAALTITQAQLLADVPKPEFETALTFTIASSTKNEDGFIFYVKE